MRKMLESQMKDVPAEQRDQIIKMVEKNPEFFQKIALEVQEITSKGKGQMEAMMEVMQKHKDELQGLM